MTDVGQTNCRHELATFTFPDCATSATGHLDHHLVSQQKFQSRYLEQLPRQGRYRSIQVIPVAMSQRVINVSSRSQLRE